MKTFTFVLAVLMLFALMPVSSATIDCQNNIRCAFTQAKLSGDARMCENLSSQNQEACQEQIRLQQEIASLPTIQPPQEPPVVQEVITQPPVVQEQHQQQNLLVPILVTLFVLLLAIWWVFFRKR